MESHWKGLIAAIVNGDEVSTDAFLHLNPAFVVKNRGRIVFARTQPNPGNPYNLPDWRQQGEYPTCGDLTSTQWRWEFLRRSEGYREFWNFNMEVIGPSGEANSCLDHHITDYYLTQLVDPQLRAIDAPREALNFAPYVVFRITTSEDLENAADGDQVASDAFDENFILRQILSPVQAAAYRDSKRTHSFRSLEDFIEFGHSSNGLLAMIRQDAPLKPQFAAIEAAVASNKAAKAVIAAKTKSPTIARLHVRKYPLYLRLLDARDSSLPKQAKWADIERVLKSERLAFEINSKSILDLFEQARTAQARIIELLIVDDRK